MKFSLFCWNIANPSEERAVKQGEWLRKRSESVFVLTETKNSKGCLFLEKYFRAYGFNVAFSKPKGKEYGVMIISKHPLQESDFSNSINFLKARIAATKINFSGKVLEVIGTYVPSRDVSQEKIKKKKRFLKILQETLNKSLFSNTRVFCGDFNVLEPDHNPHYRFFEKWEYDFYQCFNNHQLVDSFRHLNPNSREYSWVGRTGDGYRYDHCFISNDLLPSLKGCYYLHEPREKRLSDHSAIVMELGV